MVKLIVDPMPKYSLHKATVELLANRPRELTYDKICDHFYCQDIDISVYWMKLLAMGKHKQPCVNKVQALYEYLSGKQIQF